MRSSVGIAILLFELAFLATAMIEEVQPAL